MDINPYHLLQSADELVLTKLKSSIEESLKNLTKQSFRVLHMVKRFREIYSDGKPLEEFIKKAKLDTWLMGFDNLNVKITRTFDDIKRHICNIIADDQPYFQISNKFDEFKQLQDQLKTLNFPSDPQHLLTLINQDKRALNSIVHQMERPDGKGHHVTSTNMLWTQTTAGRTRSQHRLKAPRREITRHLCLVRRKKSWWTRATTHCRNRLRTETHKNLTRRAAKHRWNRSSAVRTSSSIRQRANL